MTFELSRDYRLIRQIITDVAVYPHVTDDDSPPPEEYQPPQHEAVSYVLARDGEDLLGCWIFIPQTRVLWEVHTCLLPIAYGERAYKAGKGVIQWLWENTECLRLISNVPSYNRLAAKYAERCGMVEYGINWASWLKDGKLHAQILYGVSKP